MDIKELKTKVLNNTLSSNFLVFVGSEQAQLLIHQYITKISTNKDLEIEYIDNLDDCAYADSFYMGEYLGILYVLKVKEFKSESLDFDKFINTIVVCESVEDKTQLCCNDSIVEFPKLEEWQIVDYMIDSCTGLEQNELKWLYDITKGDINRIDNELNKINIFETNKQKEVFDLLKKEKGYIDLTPFNIFSLSYAFPKKDLETIKQVIKDINNIDIEPMGLITLLSKSFKNLVYVKMKQNVKASDLGVTDKQLYGIKYSSNNYTADELVSIYHFLTGFDYKLKSGLVDMPNDRLIDYIICNVLG